MPIIYSLRRAALVSLLLAGLSFPPPARAAATMLLDDFKTPDASSVLGTRWTPFSDRVMGGISDVKLAFEPVRGKSALHLTGRVKLENNGGFIQAALPLAANDGTLDARNYQGVRLLVSGTPGTYVVHLRTSDNWLPWQHYSAPLPVSGTWQQVDVPFTAFSRSGWEVPKLALNKLKRLGLVAIKQAFDADLAVARIELY
jgi:hypothetical protein